MFNLEAQVFYRIRNRIWDQVAGLTIDEFSYEVRKQIRKQVWNKVRNGACSVIHAHARECLNE